MRSFISVGMAAACLVLGVACSTGGARGAPSALDQSLITEEQLKASPYGTAYEVVQSLRPHWLRARGRTSITQQEYVKVYLDNSLLGAVDQLRSVSTRSIASIRFLDGVGATERWGLDHGQGAILLSTRRDAK